MSKNLNQPQTNDAVLGGQSSPTSLSQCPVCKTEYTQSEVNRCSVCNWDLKPCPEAFVERHNAQLAWAREMWINFQVQEKQFHTSQSQLEEVKQEKARFEGKVLHRLEQLEQAQDRSEPVIWAQMSQDTSTVDELEKQLSRIKDQLKGAERERQELKSELDQLSSQVATLESDLQKKRADELLLSSEAGIDYSRLRNLLSAGEWEKANKETRIILKTICFRFTGIDNIYDYESIQKIPITDIVTIDKLWLHYSYNRFGFSVQKLIYNELNEDLFELGKKVGWVKFGIDKEDFFRLYEHLILEYENLFEKLRFEIDTARGHLPMLGSWFYYDDKYNNWPEDGDMEEKNDMKEPNIICIFSKLPEPGIEHN